MLFWYLYDEQTFHNDFAMVWVYLVIDVRDEDVSSPDVCCYGVASISRLLDIICLFCKRAL